MSDHKAKEIPIFSLIQAKKELELIACDPKSIPIMSPKMVTKIIEVDNVIMQDAIIIKQDMLSIGGEVAIPKQAFELQKQPATICIIGTLKQYQELIKKLHRHYPRIQTIAAVLDSFLKQKL